MNSNYSKQINCFIKILNTMERLTARNYLVGFSCADQFIVTRVIALKVINDLLQFK